jgi:hypothetical protein
MMASLDDEIRYWRLCADNTALVAGVAASRGVSPLLIDLMLADEKRYRTMADDLEVWQHNLFGER